MNLYSPQFSDSLDLSEAPVERTLLLASTPRCGSHMLGHSLAATGAMGVPFEYLNPANLEEWQRRLGTHDALSTLHALQARRTTPNGVFSIKAHFEHVDMVGGADALFAALSRPTVVHIRRADVLQQAISFAVALQTGVWITGQEEVSAEANYDADLISWCLDEIALQNAGWTFAFETAGIVPLKVFYEDMVDDLPAVIGRIASTLGVETADLIQTEQPRTTKQSQDGRTRDWIDRYRSDRRGKTRAPSLRHRLVRLIKGVA